MGNSCWKTTDTGPLAAGQAILEQRSSCCVQMGNPAYCTVMLMAPALTSTAAEVSQGNHATVKDTIGDEMQHPYARLS